MRSGAPRAEPGCQGSICAGMDPISSLEDSEHRSISSFPLRQASLFLRVRRVQRHHRIRAGGEGAAGEEGAGRHVG